MTGTNPTGLSQDVVEVSDPTLLTEAPVVSVLMLAYNHGPFIGQAIDGVLMQRTEFPFELVIGEDCSTDDTREIVLRYQLEHPELIRVLTWKRNVGAQENSRSLFEASRGEFLAFCEGDDFWTAAEKLARQAAILRARPEVAIVFHGAQLIDHATNAVLATVEHSSTPRDYSLDEVILGRAFLMPTASIVIRNTALCPLDEWLLSCPLGDYPIAIWAAGFGVAHYLPQVMSVYRRGHAGSWSQSLASNPGKDLAVWCGVIRMLEAFPAKSGRTDAQLAVDRAIRQHIRDLAEDHGSIALRGVPEIEFHRHNLTWTDRLFLFAFNDPTKIRMRGAWFIRAKWRQLKKFWS